MHLILTGVFPGTEGTLPTPGDAVQTAAFSIGSPTLLVGVCTHVVALKSLPANIHVHIGLMLFSFCVTEWDCFHKATKKKASLNIQKYHKFVRSRAHVQHLLYS